MSEQLYKEFTPGLEIAQVFPLSDDLPFFVDLVRLAPGAATEVHGQAGGYCYRMVAVTLVSGFSFIVAEDGSMHLNEHVYLRPGESITRDRDFRHKFINNCCDDIVILKSLPPPEECPRKKGGNQNCTCRGEP